MASKRVARRQQNFIQRFFRETIGELRKVSWPTRRQALNLTGIVLLVIFLLSIFFFVVDSIVFRWLFSLILGS